MSADSVPFSPRVVLVTGGAGFIGANYIHYLHERRDDVRIINLDKLTYAGNVSHLESLNDSPRYRFVQGDICDAALIASLLREEKVDAIVHFAAESHVDRSITGPAAFIETNLVGTFTLLEAARLYWLDELKLDAGGCRFHHVSTDEVYGSLGPDDEPFREDMAYLPNSPYSASKAGSDHLVRAYNETYGLPVVTTNCSNNYGPFQHSEKFIPTVVRSCFTGKPIPVYGDGSNIRDWLYVEDHCSGLLTVLEKAAIGETYNIGGGEEHSNIGIALRICALMDELHPGEDDYAKLISYVTDRPGHDWRYAIDQSKLERDLDWTPDWSFDDGLRRTIQWYLEAEHAESRLGAES